MRVFISAGTPADQQQEEFKNEVLEALRLIGLTPRIYGANDWDYKNPLRGICKCMQECDGVVVLAYPRYRVVNGVELRKPENRDLSGSEFPTPWNHVEAALAYEQDLPLLVIAQEGLKRDAFLDPSGDIRPLWYTPGSPIQSMKGFSGYLRSWKSDIEERMATKEKLREAEARAAAQLSITEVLGRLHWHDQIGLIAILLGLLTTVGTFGYRIGSGQWPF